MLRRPRSALVAVVLLGAVALTGCGAAGEANPEKIGPRGVDGLVIPTPDPDPDDFVADVDNPWFPLAAGTVWTYDVSGARADRLEVRVEDDRQVVAGVRCTVVLRRTLDQKGAAVREEESYYAQDVSGNVWLFGEQAISGTGGRSWQAGVDGAEAGVAMLAHPRVGDGYEQEHAPGVAEDRSTILSVDDERTVPAGRFTGLVVTEDTSPLGLVEVHRAYARGTGLVEATTTVGGTERIVLVEVSGP
jgi:hypothetical protein